jgi:SAM-dependent methyltransferase
MAFVSDGRLPLGGAVAELGAQRLFCVDQDVEVRHFLAFFEQRGTLERPLTTFDDAAIAAFASEGYLGALLKAVGFRYLALDIFQAPDTRLFDLNLHIVPPDLAGQFDLVTNFGTTEHVLNQMLALRTMHDLARPGGLIHHDLPYRGYHAHGYFNYNPMLFEDLARANGYEVVLQAFSRGDWRHAPVSLTEHGFDKPGYRDRGLEVVLKKTGNAPFRIPLETSTSDGEVEPTIWQGGSADPLVVVTRTEFETVTVTQTETLQAFLRRMPRAVFRRLGWSAPADGGDR